MRRDQANRIVVSHGLLLENPNLSISAVRYKQAMTPGSRDGAAKGRLRALPLTPPPPTSTASITGAWVALADCIGWMKTRNMLKGNNVLRDNVAAISCGIYNGTPVLDLDYAEDSEADTDANFVMTGDGRIIEVQGTAEKTPFSQDEFLALMALARKGVARLVDLQKMAVAS